MKNLQPQTGPGQNIFFHFFIVLVIILFIFFFIYVFIHFFYHFIFHFFSFFYHFLNHFFFQWCKKNKKMENCNFPRVFFHFFYIIFGSSGGIDEK